jgi:succinate dehydrogenase/fumarate reductase flavoprotein subunit
MSQYAGVTKNQKGLTYAMEKIIALENEFIAHYDTTIVTIKALEFQNMLQVARVILKQSILGLTSSTFNR